MLNATLDSDLDSRLRELCFLPCSYGLIMSICKHPLMKISNQIWFRDGPLTLTD